MNKLISVRPGDIVVDFEIGYRDYSSIANQEGIKELAASILARGLETPLGGYTDKNGNPHLVKGFRRYLAIKHIRTLKPDAFETVEFIASDRVPTTEEMYLDSWASNEHSQPTMVETGRLVAKLRKELKLTQAEVAKRIGKDQSYVSKVEWLTTLPSEVQVAITNGVISAKTALEKQGDKNASKLLLAIIKGDQKRTPQSTQNDRTRRLTWETCAVEFSDLAYEFHVAYNEKKLTPDFLSTYNTRVQQLWKRHKLEVGPEPEPEVKPPAKKATSKK
jgi:ParB/RepB/Spo0J family partition protein